MKAIQGVVTAVIYAMAALYIMKLGYDGLKINLRDKTSKVYKIKEVYRNASSLDGKVISLEIDSSLFIAQLEHNSNAYQFYPLDSSLNDIRILYESKHQVLDTVFGVFESFESGYPEVLLEAEDFSNLYIIKHHSQPRKWYWNALLIFIPILFLKAFIQAMTNLFRGEKFDQSS